MLKIEDLNVSFEKPFFKNQHIEIKNNSLTLIVGESGCGKTTLLYQLGLIDMKSHCHYYINNQDISNYSYKEKSLIRKHHIGFVFQDYMLYNHFDIYENLQYYASLVGKELSKEDAKCYLQLVHLDLSLDRHLITLSGGQKQRLAIACVLTKNPDILILDEPTSALDRDNARMIFQILSELKKDRTIILVSHNQDAYLYCDEIFEIKNRTVTKIKSVDIQEHPFLLSKDKESLQFSLYKQYIKKEYQSSKKMKKMIAIVSMLIFILCLAVSEIISYHIEANYSIISQDNPAQLYISSLKNKNLNSFKNVKIYPYYNQQLTILGNSYDVIPYYDEMMIQDKVWTTYSLERKGFYFSNAMYLDIKDVIVPSNKIDFWMPDGSKSISLDYRGILLKGVESEYTKTSKYIYMHYSDIERKLRPKTIEGYTLFCFSYDSYLQVKDVAKKLGYQVQSFNQLNEIENFVELLNTIYYIAISITVLLGAIALNFLYYTYLNIRKKELALLKCNGMTNIDISLMVFLDVLIINVLCFISITILTLWIISTSILRLFLFEFIILICIFFIINKFIYKIDPVQVLRND